MCAPDFGLADLDFGLPERDLALPEPDRDLLDPLLDRDVLREGLTEVCDFGLVEPDLLLWADLDRDLLERAGEGDLLWEAFDDFLDRPEALDFGDSLPDLAGL